MNIVHKKGYLCGTRKLIWQMKQSTCVMKMVSTSDKDLVMSGNGLISGNVALIKTIFANRIRFIGNESAF